jgi:hypothetical protein
MVLEHTVWTGATIHPTNDLRRELNVVHATWEYYLELKMLKACSAQGARDKYWHTLRVITWKLATDVLLVVSGMAITAFISMSAAKNYKGGLQNLYPSFLGIGVGAILFSIWMIVFLWQYARSSHELAIQSLRLSRSVIKQMDIILSILRHPAMVVAGGYSNAPTTGVKNPPGCVAADVMHIMGAAAAKSEQLSASWAEARLCSCGFLILQALSAPLVVFTAYHRDFHTTNPAQIASFCLGFACAGLLAPLLLTAEALIIRQAQSSKEHTTVCEDLIGKGLLKLVASIDTSLLSIERAPGPPFSTFMATFSDAEQRRVLALRKSASVYGHVVTAEVLNVLHKRMWLSVALVTSWILVTGAMIVGGALTVVVASTGVTSALFTLQSASALGWMKYEVKGIGDKYSEITSSLNVNRLMQQVLLTVGKDSLALLLKSMTQTSHKAYTSSIRDRHDNRGPRLPGDVDQTYGQTLRDRGFWRALWTSTQEETKIIPAGDFSASFEDWLAFVLDVAKYADPIEPEGINVFLGAEAKLAPLEMFAEDLDREENWFGQ